MSTYQGVIDALVARLNTVTNVGQVHGYTRFNADWSTYLDQFKATVSSVDQIRGWIVTMAPFEPIAGEPFSFGSTKRTYTAHVHGYLGLSDAANTEDTFLTLVETVMNALDGRIDLSVASIVDYGVGPCSLRYYQIRQLGSVLCHYGQITVPVEVEVSLTYV